MEVIGMLGSNTDTSSKCITDFFSLEFLLVKKNEFMTSRPNRQRVVTF